MVKSMTAYGRASQDFPLGRWVIEMHSINRKMLDMQIYLPKELLCFDIEMRKWIAEEIGRGQVTVKLNLQQDLHHPQNFKTDFFRLKALKKEWEKIAFELGFDPKQSISLPFLAEQLGLSSPQWAQDEKEVRKNLKDLFSKALTELMGMKVQEGEALSKDIGTRLNTIEDCLLKIESRKGDAVLRYRERLQERLQEFPHLQAENEERLSREIALLADKLDITEELVRLKSHLEQFRKALSSEEKSIGRTLDFLTQEILREVNTIASKSADSEVSLLTVCVKGELEKIREQVQNIE